VPQDVSGRSDGGSYGRRRGWPVALVWRSRGGEPTPRDTPSGHGAVASLFSKPGRRPKASRSTRRFKKLHFRKQGEISDGGVIAIGPRYECILMSVRIMYKKTTYKRLAFSAGRREGRGVVRRRTEDGSVRLGAFDGRNWAGLDFRALQGGRLHASARPGGRGRVHSRAGRFAKIRSRRCSVLIFICRRRS